MSVKSARARKSAFDYADGMRPRDIVKRVSVPSGLEVLLTDLTLQVLKMQPKDIYTFAADHFDHLIQVRAQMVNRDKASATPEEAPTKDNTKMPLFDGPTIGSKNIAALMAGTLVPTGILLAANPHQFAGNNNTDENWDPQTIADRSSAEPLTTEFIDKEGIDNEFTGLSPHFFNGSPCSQRSASTNHGDSNGSEEHIMEVANSKFGEITDAASTGLDADNNLITAVNAIEKSTVDEIIVDAEAQELECANVAEAITEAVSAVDTTPDDNGIIVDSDMKIEPLESPELVETLQTVSSDETTQPLEFQDEVNDGEITLTNDECVENTSDTEVEKEEASDNIEQLSQVEIDDALDDVFITENTEDNTVIQDSQVSISDSQQLKENDAVIEVTPHGNIEETLETVESTLVEESDASILHQTEEVTPETSVAAIVTETLMAEKLILDEQSKHESNEDTIIVNEADVPDVPISPFFDETIELDNTVGSAQELVYGKDYESLSTVGEESCASSIIASSTHTMEAEVESVISSMMIPSEENVTEDVIETGNVTDESVSGLITDEAVNEIEQVEAAVLAQIENTVGHENPPEVMEMVEQIENTPRETISNITSDEKDFIEAESSTQDETKLSDDAVDIIENNDPTEAENEEPNENNALDENIDNAVYDGITVADEESADATIADADLNNTDNAVEIENPPENDNDASETITDVVANNGKIYELDNLTQNDEVAIDVMTGIASNTDVDVADVEDREQTGETITEVVTNRENISELDNLVQNDMDTITGIPINTVFDITEVEDQEQIHDIEIISDDNNKILITELDNSAVTAGDNNEQILEVVENKADSNIEHDQEDSLQEISINENAENENIAQDKTNPVDVIEDVVELNVNNPEELILPNAEINLVELESTKESESDIVEFVQRNEVAISPEDAILDTLHNDDVDSVTNLIVEQVVEDPITPTLHVQNENVPADTINSVNNSDSKLEGEIQTTMPTEEIAKQHDEQQLLPATTALVVENEGDEINSNETEKDADNKDDTLVWDESGNNDPEHTLGNGLGKSLNDADEDDNITGHDQYDHVDSNPEIEDSTATNKNIGNDSPAASNEQTTNEGEIDEKVNSDTGLSGQVDEHMSGEQSQTLKSNVTDQEENDTEPLEDSKDGIAVAPILTETIIRSDSPNTQSAELVQPNENSNNQVQHLTEIDTSFADYDLVDLIDETLKNSVEMDASTVDRDYDNKIETSIGDDLANTNDSVEIESLLDPEISSTRSSSGKLENNHTDDHTNEDDTQLGENNITSVNSENSGSSNEKTLESSNATSLMAQSEIAIMEDESQKSDIIEHTDDVVDEKPDILVIDPNEEVEADDSGGSPSLSPTSLAESVIRLDVHNSESETSANTPGLLEIENPENLNLNDISNDVDQLSGLEESIIKEDSVHNSTDIVESEINSKEETPVESSGGSEFYVFKSDTLEAKNIDDTQSTEIHAVIDTAQELIPTELNQSEAGMEDKVPNMNVEDMLTNVLSVPDTESNLVPPVITNDVSDDVKPVELPDNTKFQSFIYGADASVDNPVDASYVANLIEADELSDLESSENPPELLAKIDFGADPMDSLSEFTDSLNEPEVLAKVSVGTPYSPVPASVAPPPDNDVDVTEKAASSGLSTNIFKMNRAIVSIQSFWRGFLARKRLKSGGEPEEPEREEGLTGTETAGDVVNNDDAMAGVTTGDAPCAHQEATAAPAADGRHHEAATIIQRQFRQYQAHRQTASDLPPVHPERNDAADATPQHTGDGRLTSNSGSPLNPPNEDPSIAETDEPVASKIESEPSTEVSAKPDAEPDTMKYSPVPQSASMPENEEYTNSTNTAATKIQAGFRGYQVRKQIKDRESTLSKNSRKSSKRSSPTSPAKRTPTPISDELMEKSATKIQAGVRGFLVRKREQKKKE